MGYRDVPIATESCPGCHAEVPRGTEICPSCGSPVEIARFAELELRLKPSLRRARIFLGVVTALGAMELAAAAALGEGTIAPAFSFVFFGTCFVVAFKRPLGASIAAMAMFLFDEAAVLGMGRLELVLEGLVLKVLLFTSLAAAIRSGYRARDLRGQWRKRDRTLGIAVLAAGVILGLAFGLVTSLRLHGRHSAPQDSWSQTTRFTARPTA
jgi:hypothetical protein